MVYKFTKVTDKRSHLGAQKINKSTVKASDLNKMIS